MRLKLHIDTQEEGDPQSPVPPASIEGMKGIFEEELLLLYPEASDYDETEFSVSLLDSAEMLEINKEHRGVDAPTDVLSFPLWEEDGRFVPKSAATGLLPLGDVLICPEETMKTHVTRSPESAICLVLAHGFLHLLAWDHDTEEKEQTMWEQQERISARLLDSLTVSASRATTGGEG